MAQYDEDELDDQDALEAEKALEDQVDESAPSEDQLDESPDLPKEDAETDKEIQAAEDTGEHEAGKQTIPDEIKSHSDELLSEMAPETPEAAPAPKAAPSQLDKYRNFMDEYKSLQDQRSRGNLVAGLAAAGGKIGQSIAGKYSGNFTPDMSGVKFLQDQANIPVQNFEKGQVVQSRGMQLQSEIAASDPTSPQSKLVRDYLSKRLGMTLPETVSASDAMFLMKTMGRPVQTKFQKVNGTWTDPETGASKRMSAVFDPASGSYRDPDTGKSLPGFIAEGLNPFQLGKGEHGESVVFNKSRGGAPTPVSGAPNFTGAQNSRDIYNNLQPDLRKELDNKIVPNFNQLTQKTQQRLMHQAPIMAKLEEAKLNPAAYAQLQAELARFDVGDQRLAQQEFNMFATRHGYKGWGDWVQKNSEGTISSDFADDFAHTINNTVQGMQEDLNKQAEKHASLLIGRLPSNQQVDPKLIAPLIYAGYKPANQTRMLIDKRDGQLKPIKADKYDAALKAKDADGNSLFEVPRQ
jgi:hypothetical protein